MDDSNRTLSTVIGIVKNPTNPRATAPVAKFACIDSLGRSLEYPFAGADNEASIDLILPKLVKYKDAPTDVRKADGTVPRQSSSGPDKLRMALAIVVPGDCCNRVFSRSSGCRHTEDVSPPRNPATRCEDGLNSPISLLPAHQLDQVSVTKFVWGTHCGAYKAAETKAMHVSFFNSNCEWNERLTFKITD